MENTMEITVFQLTLASFYSTLPKNVYGFQLTIPELKEKTLFYMSNKFLEALLKFQTSWQ